MFQILQTVSARSESLKPLRPNEMVTLECLNCLTDIIGNANNKAGLVVQCLHILTNLGENWTEAKEQMNILWGKRCGIVKHVKSTHSHRRYLCLFLMVLEQENTVAVTEVCNEARNWDRRLTLTLAEWVLGSPDVQNKVLTVLRKGIKAAFSLIVFAWACLLTSPAKYQRQRNLPSVYLI